MVGDPRPLQAVFLLPRCRRALSEAQTELPAVLFPSHLGAAVVALSWWHCPGDVRGVMVDVAHLQGETHPQGVPHQMLISLLWRHFANGRQ